LEVEEIRKKQIVEAATRCIIGRGISFALADLLAVRTGNVFLWDLRKSLNHVIKFLRNLLKLMGILLSRPIIHKYLFERRIPFSFLAFNPRIIRIIKLGIRQLWHSLSSAGNLVV